MSGKHRTKPHKAASAETSRASAVALVLSGSTQQQISDTLGVSRSQVSRWMQEPEVRAELERATDAVIDAAVSKLRGLSTKAVDRLGALIDDDDAQVALGASRTVLDRIERLSAKTSGKVEHSGSVVVPVVIVESTVDIQVMRTKARALDAGSSEQEKDDSD